MKLDGYRKTFFDYAEEVMAIGSPSGFTHDLAKYLREENKKLGFGYEETNKGCVIINVEGRDSSKTVALTAHGDTLGAMVRSISEKGEIKFVTIGGPIIPTLDSEYCAIHTRGGKTYTGTFICEHAAAHVHPEASKAVRTADNLYVRLDEEVKK